MIALAMTAFGAVITFASGRSLVRQFGWPTWRDIAPGAFIIGLAFLSLGILQIAGVRP